MPLPLLAVLVPVIVKAVTACVCVGGTCYCAKKAYDAYSKGQKTKRMKYKDREATRQAALEDNKIVKAEETKENQKLEEINSKLEKRDKEIKKLQNKLKDPNLSSEEKSKINSQLALLLTQQEDDEKDKKEIIEKLEQLTERMKKNNKTINNPDSTDNDRDWIWEFLTLENILIMLAIYALYNIVRDERKH